MASIPGNDGFTKDWVVWQMVDSLYPTGGFAHSNGLEAAVQEKIVSKDNDSVSLRQFLSSTVHQTANFALPIVYSMHSAATSHLQQEQAIVDAFLSLNAQATALISNHVAKKASIAQGAALLRLAISTYHSAPNDRFQVLVTIRKASKRHKQLGIHHTVMFGLVTALLNVDAATCQRMYLFFVLRDTLSAATRLNLIGPFEATRLQFEMGPLVEKVFQSKKDRLIEDSYSSAPLLDLIQAMHDQLYTRIFNS